jgi:hypothetical protein
MEIYKDKKQENFTLVVTRNELGEIRDALGAREMQNDKPRNMYMQIVKEME